jgi:hypothetical protein
MTELAVVIGIILFPGIIATVIADKLVVHVRPWGSFKYGLYAFVFGVTCYGVLQIVARAQAWLPLDWQPLSSLAGTLQVWSVVGNASPAVAFPEVFAATVMGVPVAFVSAFLVNHKVFHRLGNKIRVSRKYGDENLYTFYLNSKELDWVYVRDFERKLTYQGRIFSFSENDTCQEVVLSDVTVFGYEASEEYYSVPTLYLCRPRGSIVIEQIPSNLLEPDDAKEATA